jgi:tetratricopeptide (TPR) repeat protein
VFRLLAALAREGLGPQHPLTLLLGCFSKAAAISTSYPTLWMCVIDHIDQMADDQLSRGEAQEIRIKAYFYLIRVLRNNGNHFAAIQRCQELIQLCIATDGFRSFSANRARYNLAVNHCEAGNLEAAMEAYGEARKYLGTADCPYEGWVFAVFATNELAQLYEQEGNVDKAGEYYEEALVSFLQRGGNESSGALLMLKDLIDFHKRYGHEEQLGLVQIQYPACFALLLADRLDNLRLWVGRRVTTQASGGKKNRAWTWTSPIDIE